MFILIPLILILASLGGIFFIVWRKFPHLEALSELNTNTIGSFSIKKDWWGLIDDLCPEVLHWAKNIRAEEKWKEYREVWFIEIEKFLRRLRVFSLKIDRMSDSLIKKIRSKTYTNGNIVYTVNDGNSTAQGPVNTETSKNIKEEFKREEQKLILEIARNPKSAVLYEELGDLCYGAGDYKDAKESYEAAIELSPQNEELKKKLSQALEKLTQPQGSQY